MVKPNSWGFAHFSDGPNDVIQHVIDMASQAYWFHIPEKESVRLVLFVNLFFLVGELLTNRTLSRKSSNFWALIKKSLC